MGKVGRNVQCPCGSGKKYKRCCGLASGAVGTYTLAQRELAIRALHAFADRPEWLHERLEAIEELWGDYEDRFDELDEGWREVIDGVESAWLWFDHPLADGRSIAESFAASADWLDGGARAWLRQASASVMRLYEVMDARPGVSVTLRDLVDGGDPLVVSERTLSRSVSRGQAIAARVVRAGASGRPELELSVLPISLFVLDDLVDELKEWRDAHRRAHPSEPPAAFWKLTPPLICDVWASALLDPVIPRLANTDGEPLVWSVVQFDVVDAAALRRALDAVDWLASDGEGGWSWDANVGRADAKVMGSLQMDGAKLVLECNSVERAERGRALVEDAAGAAIRFVVTSHEDLQAAAQRSMRSGQPAPSTAPEADIPPEVVEELTLDYYARHYRSWVDERIPALGGQTPREAAGSADRRDAVIGLIRGLEGRYQDALRSGQPAYDPSWMWEELALAPASVDLPPPLAHERLTEGRPKLAEAARRLAERVRARPGFDERHTLVTSDDLATDLDLRRLGALDEASTGIGPWLVDFELHRRKTFWVDRALTWQLAHTDLDVCASELRLPFASFAVVFTDRHALSLAERLVAKVRPNSPVAGHFARVVTVYVAGRADAGMRLHVAVDALGADPPEVITHDLAPDARVGAVAGSSPQPPLPGLLHLVASAILYATLPGAPRDARGGRDPARTAPPREDTPYTSDAVYYLPGAITISRLRRLQELERAPGGRQLLHRFLVRGHWRRPNPKWKDQSPRWIEPYWKGPDIGAVIERAYKLKP